MYCSAEALSLYHDSCVTFLALNNVISDLEISGVDHREVFHPCGRHNMSCQCASLQVPFLHTVPYDILTHLKSIIKRVLIPSMVRRLNFF